MVEFIYQFFELFATFIEGVLAIFVSTSLAGRKLSIKQNILYEYVNHIYHSHYIIK